jgi:hypothetical protein
VWLPSQFYEKAPHYWLILGLLFIVVGSYLGLQIGLNYLYFGVAVGLSCCGWSIRVFNARAKHRRPESSGESEQLAQPESELTDNA